MRNAARLIAAASVALLLLAGCSSSGDKGDGGNATTTIAAEPIKILVTNDDGYNADGIDAVVEGLRTVEGVQVTVVAPATNQSGTGGNTTTGALVVTDATTKSGYPAKAVAGFPADTIVWAIDQHGIDFTPDLVISGINAGQNMGPAVDVSGTVGAARAAVTRGIPALAASQGPLVPPQDFSAGRAQVVKWIQDNMTAIVDRTLTTATVANLNVPTCPTGAVRGQIDVPVAPTTQGYTDTPNCTSTLTGPTDDIQAYLNGFAPLSELSLTPAPTP